MTEQKSLDRALRFSRKGLALPWLDESGDPIAHFAAAFGRRQRPAGEWVGEQAGLVIARVVWDELPDEERRLGLPIMQNAERAAEWLMTGVSETGLAPEFEAWRTSQRQLVLAKLLGTAWRAEGDMPLSKMPDLKRQLDARPVSGFAKLCKMVIDKFEPAEAPVENGKSKSWRLATGRGPYRALRFAGYTAPWVVGQALCMERSSGFAMTAALGAVLAWQVGGALARFGLSISLGGGTVSLTHWVAARLSMPALRPAAKKAAEAEAARGWALCGGLSEVKGISKVSTGLPHIWGGERPLKEILRVGSANTPGVAAGMPAALAAIERIDATLSLSAFVAREERDQISALLSAPADGASSAQGDSKKPRKASRL
jgi:hypothetical protein